MRLDKFLSNMGLGTRSEIKKQITRGHVMVDGCCVKKVGQNINPDTESVTLNNHLVIYEPFVYIMLNKPAGVVSATKDNQHKTVIDLVKGVYGNREIFPVGRLDIDTEGLLLLTNDGDFNHTLMAPKKHVEKTYYADIDGEVTLETVDQFLKGIVLNDGYNCKPAKLEIISSGEESEIYLTITEGKFHQVKRMFESVDMEVEYLKRVRIGNLPLDETLGLGDFRALTEEERKKIKP